VQVCRNATENGLVCTHAISTRLASPTGEEPCPRTLLLVAIRPVGMRFKRMTQRQLEGLDEVSGRRSLLSCAARKLIQILLLLIYTPGDEAVIEDIPKFGSVTGPLPNVDMPNTDLRPPPPRRDHQQHIHSIGQDHPCIGSTNMYYPQFPASWKGFQAH
jgi:hypothetical protein